jgi:CheY-like chemotaxis protein
MHAVTHGYHDTYDEQHTFESKTALVVDDELSNRVILKAFLKKSGYQVIEAENGATALTLFLSQQPDMVFMDVMMPVMDGHEAVRRIRAIDTSRFVPIIFLTASSDEKVLTRCIEVGGDDFLTKPFSHTVLHAKVQSLERISGLHDKLGRLYSQMKKDEEMAEGVFSNAVVAGNVAMEHLPALLQPADVFSGDVLLTAYTPSGDLNVIMGDFTGHGLAAAIGALPASEAFRAMTNKGFAPHQILAGINQKLNKLLPTGVFFAVQFVTLSRTLKHITVCNCGMPDVLLIDGKHGTVKKRFASNNLPLSIDPGCSYEETIQLEVVEQGDHVLLVSDGALEARNPNKEYFGGERLEAAIAAAPTTGKLIDEISRSLRDFCLDAPQDDDISLAAIPCLPELVPEWDDGHAQEHASPRQGLREESSLSDQLEFSITLSGARLRETDPVPLAINHIQEMLGLQNHRRLLFTILTELYVNALDHGVLRLQSNLKQTAEGFTRYFSERETRLESLADGHIKILINAKPSANGGRMTIEIEDSGEGFDFTQFAQKIPSQETLLSGRGLSLVTGLCESVEFISPGNRVKAVFAWLND